MKENLDKDNFRMYYQLQYERIDHLETKRENFSNFVLTISSGVFILAVTNAKDFDIKLAIGIFLFITSINLISIQFAKSTIPFIKMHQERAKAASEKFDSNLKKINKDVGKPNPRIKILYWSFSSKRYNLYKLLHWIIIIFSGLLTFYLVKLNSF